MRQLIQLETGYKPPPSTSEQEREWLKKLAEDVLADDRFQKAFTLMIDIYEVLRIVAKMPGSSDPEYEVYVDGHWQPDKTWVVRDLRK